MPKFKTATSAISAAVQGEFIHLRAAGLPPSLRHSAQAWATQPSRRGRMVIFHERPAVWADAKIPKVDGD